MNELIDLKKEKKLHLSSPQIAFFPFLIYNTVIIKINKNNNK